MNRCGALVLIALLVCSPRIGAGISLSEDGYHVFPGDKIQEALQLAARNKTNKVVKVHAGEYRPESKRQALIWFNKMHDGIHLEAQGEVHLTAVNSELSSKEQKGYPAVVNHVIYLGDGISSNTIVKGFKISGANNFVSQSQTSRMEPNVTIPKNFFFFADGGAIKVFGRSYPRLEELEIVENFTSPCGAGISVQHQGHNQSAVLIENCIFRGNRTQVTGAAVDLLAGSSARIINCLFVENVSNMGEDVVAKGSGEPPFVNSGVLTIFQNSFAEVRNCTFTGNRNGIDDMGGKSGYFNCIFYNNNLDAGLKGLPRYDLALKGATQVAGCFFNGVIHDAQKVIVPETNVLNAPDPLFDKNFVPKSAQYKNAGYRPVSVNAVQ